MLETYPAFMGCGMGEDQLVAQALEKLLPFFRNEATGCHAGMKAAFLRYNGAPPTPKTAAEVNELEILHYCNARFKLADLNDVTSKHLQRLLVVLRISFLLKEVDPRNKSQCIYSPIKQTIAEAKQVEETQLAMETFIGDSLTSASITLEKLEECYTKIYRALSSNRRTVVQTGKALKFIDDGAVARTAVSTISAVLDATSKAMTTHPNEKERLALYSEMNARDMTRPLDETNELRKCDIYASIFRDQLPKLEKANKTQYHLFNKILRELLLKYDYPIVGNDRKQLNKRLRFAAAKLATAFERVKVEQQISGYGEKKLRSGYYVSVAAAIRREIFPSRNYNSDSLDVVEALKKPNNLLSIVDKLRRNEIINKYLTLIKHMATKAADLLGFEVSDIPASAISPDVETDEMAAITEIIADEYEKSPDADTQRDRFLRRIRKLRQALADLMMVTEASQGIDPREGIRQLLEPQAEELFFSRNTRIYAAKSHVDHPNSYINFALIKSERAAAFEKLKDDVAQLLGVVETEIKILSTQRGDAQRQANLTVIGQRLGILQLQLPANAANGTAAVLLPAQEAWTNIHETYVNLAPAQPGAAPADVVAPTVAAKAKAGLRPRYDSA